MYLDTVHLWVWLATLFFPPIRGTKILKKTYLLSYFVPLNTLHIIKGTTKTPTVDLLRLNTNSLGVSFFFFVFFVYFFPVHFEFLRGFFYSFSLFVYFFFFSQTQVHLFTHIQLQYNNNKEQKRSKKQS